MQKLEVFIPGWGMWLCGYVDVAPIFIPKRKKWLCRYVGTTRIFIPIGEMRLCRYVDTARVFIPKKKNGCAGMLEQRKYSYLGGEYGGAGMLEVPNKRKGMSAMKPKICRKILNGVALVGMGIAFFANIPALKPIRMEMIYGAAFLVIADVIFGLLFLRARTVKNY